MSRVSGSEVGEVLRVWHNHLMSRRPQLVPWKAAGLVSEQQ